MIEEQLLGFDVRERWMQSHELWDEARRSRYLLRLDVAMPLSTDTVVWPSVFDTGQGIGLPAAERARFGLAGLLVPSWIGRNAGLWDSLADMRRYLRDHWKEPRPHTSIAVSWLWDGGWRNHGEAGPYLGATTPAQLDSAWTLLGFDVSDSSLLSAVSNCGYSAAEIGSLRRHWGPLLNSSHLFGDPEPAFQFQRLANTLVPEHAPFFVYGLYAVD